MNFTVGYQTAPSIGNWCNFFDKTDSTSFQRKGLQVLVVQWNIVDCLST